MEDTMAAITNCGNGKYSLKVMMQNGGLTYAEMEKLLEDLKNALSDASKNPLLGSISVHTNKNNRSKQFKELSEELDMSFLDEKPKPNNIVRAWEFKAPSRQQMMHVNSQQ